jgi:hypothetical protein
MASDAELLAWLRAQITEDGTRAAARLRRQMSDAYRRAQAEKLARAKGELAVLGLYERQAAKLGESALQEDRLWTLAPVVRLLACGYGSGYGRREGCPASEDELWEFYLSRTEGP